MTAAKPPPPKPIDFDIKVGDVLTYGEFGRHQMRVTRLDVARRERTRLKPRSWELRIRFEEIAG